MIPPEVTNGSFGSQGMEQQGAIPGEPANDDLLNNKTYYMSGGSNNSNDSQECPSFGEAAKRTANSAARIVVGSSRSTLSPTVGGRASGAQQAKQGWDEYNDLADEVMECYGENSENTENNEDHDSQEKSSPENEESENNEEREEEGNENEEEEKEGEERPGDPDACYGDNVNGDPFGIIDDPAENKTIKRDTRLGGEDDDGNYIEYELSDDGHLGDNGEPEGPADPFGIVDQPEATVDDPHQVVNPAQNQ